MHVTQIVFCGEMSDTVAAVLMSHSVCFISWDKNAASTFHNNMNNEVQVRNEACRRALCTNASKQFIRRLMKASCVCSALCTLTHSAGLMYSTRLPSDSLPMFHHKTLFHEFVLPLKLNMMLGFYLIEGRGEWFSVCWGLKITFARCASAMWF